MKIIRWLLSNTFLILLIVVVIYGYMFWGNLLGEDTPAGKAIAYLSSEFVEVEEFVNAVKSKQAELAGDKVGDRTGDKTGADSLTSAQTDQGIESAAVPETTARAAAPDRQMMPRSVSQPPVQVPPASISYSHNQMRVQQNSAGVTESGIDRRALAMAPTMAAGGTRSAAPAVAGGNKTEQYVTAEVEKQLSNVDEHGRVIDASQASASVKESWVTARKSFYQRNYEKSEQSYQNVIDSTEDNFDAYGELGNVYFNQGKNRQAASAYFEAAAILVRKGQVNRAKSLMGLLRHLDKSKADELQGLIDSATQS